MSHSPYSPPTARVSDPAEAPQQAPTSVTRAVACLWLSASLAVLAGGWQLLSATGLAHVLGVVLNVAFSAGLVAFVATKLRARRGWARWLYLAIFALGSLLFMIAVVLAPGAFRALPPLSQAFALLQFVLQTAALIFVFTPSAWHWLSGSHPAV
jgi:hypothetical protein